jgi:hypothetical protein
MEDALALFLAALGQNNPTNARMPLDLAAVEFRSTSAVEHIFQFGIFRKPRRGKSSQGQILIRADANWTKFAVTAKANFSETARMLKFPSHSGRPI